MLSRILTKETVLSVLVAEIRTLLRPVLVSILIVKPHEDRLVHGNWLNVDQWSLQGQQNQLLVFVEQFVLEGIPQVNGSVEKAYCWNSGSASSKITLRII